MYDSRNKLSVQVEEDVREVMGATVYKTIIPRNVKISEAPSHGQPVILYDSQCIGSEAYINPGCRGFGKRKFWRCIKNEKKKNKSISKSKVTQIKSKNQNFLKKAWNGFVIAFIYRYSLRFHH